MVPKTTEKSCVEAISLAPDMDQRIALATVRLGDVLIRGVAVWRGRYGRLRVYFPSYRLGSGWDEVISLPDELRTEIEADVISAYKASKSAANKSVRNSEKEEFSKNAL